MLARKYIFHVPIEHMTAAPLLSSLRKYAGEADLQRGGHGVALRPWMLSHRQDYGFKGYADPASSSIAKNHAPICFAFTLDGTRTLYPCSWS